MNNGVQVRYFAAARAAAGVESAIFAPASLDSIISLACSTNPSLKHVLSQCSFLLDSVLVHDQSIFVNDGSVIDVLPRFAGG
ncbi:unannotated protein [freshwater metagenome]|uniref:Unannotated protein n=1 Tax=freshwater metagenome TaxID=449393 RepID=A0A6J7LR37_9ZZZZ|nr:hypothetical protein [Actinomycetota bacterium]MSW62161.1 hypothetical protein [Actinomycetota bacterium]MSX89240.1 hypothetical protein [Actinomycetota bacterium]MSZ63679.1 hypothetical protein [Actinomycetota bacterium]MTA58224.1 hypothetical protein [Actinomycetota bacterium]